MRGPAIILALLFIWCPPIAFIILAIEYFRSQDQNDKFKKRVEELEESAYPSRGHGEEVQEHEHHIPFPRVINAETEETYRKAFPDQETVWGPWFRKSSPPPLPSAQKPLNRWETLDSPENPISFKPYVRTMRDAYNSGIMIDPPRDATPEEVAAWWNSPCPVFL